MIGGVYKKMPTYEYVCINKECGQKEYEKMFIPMKDATKKQPCPKCGKDGQRIFSTSTIII